MKQENTTVEKESNVYMLMNANNEEKVRNLIVELTNDKGWNDTEVTTDYYIENESGETIFIKKGLLKFMKTTIKIHSKCETHYTQRYFYPSSLKDNEGDRVLLLYTDGNIYDGNGKQHRGKKYHISYESLGDSTIRNPSMVRGDNDINFLKGYTHYLRFHYNANWSIPEQSKPIDVNNGILGGRHRKRLIAIMNILQKYCDSKLKKNTVKWFATKSECKEKMIKTSTCSETDF